VHASRFIGITRRTEVIDGQNHSVLVERHLLVRKLLLSWLAEHA